MTKTPRSLVGILIELKGYCMMTSFYCNYQSFNPLVCCFLCKLGSLFLNLDGRYLTAYHLYGNFGEKFPSNGTGMCFWHRKQERDCVVLFTKYR